MLAGQFADFSRNRMGRWRRGNNREPATNGSRITNSKPALFPVESKEPQHGCKVHGQIMSISMPDARLFAVFGTAAALAVLSGCDNGSRPAVNAPVRANAAAERTNSHEHKHLAASPPIDITFADLDLQMKAEQIFREEMLTERAKKLIGKRIRIEGVMFPDKRAKDLDSFVLMKSTSSSLGPGGTADIRIVVTMRKGVTTDYPGDQRLDVEGVLRLNPLEGLDGNTWSIYDLEDASNVSLAKPHSSEPHREERPRS